MGTVYVGEHRDLGVHRAHAGNEPGLRARGAGRMHHTVEVEDTPSVRGMINKIPHLVKIEES